MPELAEVETIRRQLDKQICGRKIENVELDEKDRWLFAFAKPDEVRKALVGAKITGSGRKGKYFWLELNRKPWPLFHLGMSGNISFLSPQEGLHRKAWGGEAEWKKDDPNILWFARLVLQLDKGFEIAFIDPRRFGRMWLTDEPFKHPRIAALGFDPLLDFPSAKKLAEKMARKKAPIKGVLLDQRLFAGIGNWLADEILYQARISPHRIAKDLSAVEVKRLHDQTLAVVKKAVAVNADYERFPKTWLFHHRWGKNKKALTGRKHKIIHETIAGRTSAWAPGWQK